jgi:predicted GNAT family N-acyltransferase
MAVEVSSFAGSDPRLVRCLELRRVVFIMEQSVPVPEDVDGRDPQCTQFLAFDRASALGTADLGTARLRITPDGVAKAERVAVHRASRGLGVGRLLMLALQAEAASEGHREVQLSAQEEAIPFYEGLGYVAHGPSYLDANIPHRDMTIRL